MLQETSLSQEPQVTVITARPGWKALNVRELWQFRELLYYLAWRDIKVRYKQSLLGATWAVIQPFMYMVVFTIVFGKIARLPSDGIPYPIFSFSGLLLWTFFSNSISQAGNSVVNAGHIVTKVYFPRLAIPFASVGSGLFDLVISFAALVGIIGYYRYFTDDAAMVTMSWQILMVLPLIVITTLAALAVGVMLAALNVSYRDFKHTIPFIVQLWMYATPAIYMGSHPAPADPPPAVAKADAPAAASKPAASKPAASKPKSGNGIVPDSVQSLVELNPMIGLIRSFRAAVLNQPIPWGELGYSTAATVVAFILACFYFHRVEDTFADVI